MAHTKRISQFIFFLLVLTVVSNLPFALQLFHSAQESIIDKFFTEKPPSSNVVVIAIDDISIAQIGQWPWPRAVYADALNELLSHQPKAIGIDVSFSEASRVGTEDDLQLTEAFKKLKQQSIPVVLPVDLGETGTVISQPLPPFLAETYQGFINLPIDKDNTIRTAYTHKAGSPIPSFPSLLAGQINTPPQQFRIDYRGKNTFLTIPFIDLINKRIPGRVFTDKIVLIGATAPNLHDTGHTPVGNLSGVHINAHVIETILQGNFYQKLNNIAALMLIIAIVFGIAITFRYIKKTIPLIITLSFLFIIIVIAASISFSAYTILPIFYLLLAFFIAVGASLLFEYITEKREKAFIHKSFEYYLTPQVIRELMEHPEKLTLGGESRRMTILFSDIRGFTTLSEALSPQELTDLLNKYLSSMTDIIMEHNGVVDKYIGDAIMAFWGAPLDNEKQAEDACKSATHMIRALEKLNKNFPHKLNIGIGLNTGTVVVGNMGSARRFNYTVMGDEVNLASRLESLTKYYGVSTIVTEATKNDCPRLLFRELDLVIVKGKKEPRKIFELITEKPSEPLKKALKYFDQGRAAYTKGNWDKAIELFEKTLTIRNDGPSMLFIERCNHLKKHPPKDWDGVYRFEHK